MTLANVSVGSLQETNAVITMRRLVGGIGLLTMVGVLAWPSVASATIYTPDSAASGCSGASATTCTGDLYDLDHHLAFTWRIAGLSVGAGQYIDSAKITFTKLYNWDSNVNELFIHLLDTAKTSGLTLAAPPTSGYVSGAKGTNGNNADGVAGSGINWYVDDTTNGGTLAALVDTFTAKAGTDWIVSANTLDTKLTQHSFSPLGANPVTGNPGGLNPVDKTFGGSTGWTYTAAGGGLYNYTYTFSSTQLTTLATYIGLGGDIALGFDADCHYYNNGLTFEYTTAPAVPEPASILLLGSGLLAAGWLRRRKCA